MTTITIAAAFTADDGVPATGLVLADIALHLVARSQAMGAQTVIWDGSEHPTAEITALGMYTRQYLAADLGAYDYFAGAQYTGALDLDAVWSTGEISRDSAAAAAALTVPTGPTLAMLRVRCRLILPSTEDWPDASLDAWIGDAIRFYSNEFPWLIRYPLTLVTGVQDYVLPAGCVGVVAVEYPAGEHPPRMVGQVGEESARFQAGGAVYAVRGAGGAGGSGFAVIFAEAVQTGETATVSYLGPHAVPTTDEEATSVSEQHAEALIAFVDFRAHAQLESDEAVSLSNVSIILSQLGQEARLAWRRYKEVVERLQAMTPAPNGRVVWGRIGL